MNDIERNFTLLQIRVKQRWNVKWMYHDGRTGTKVMGKICNILENCHGRVNIETGLLTLS